MISDVEAMRALLQQTSPPYAHTVVPYQQNRMVMFDSALLHKTDSINFKSGYGNRRINLTYLYGKSGRSAKSRGEK
jgi:hypothetical protein